MPDLRFSAAGDIELSPSGDIAMTETPWRDYAQQAYVTMMTPPGDWLLYQEIGTDLEQLMGMPQTEETGDVGRRIILDALGRTSRFQGVPLSIKAVPTGHQSIRFDIYVTAGQRTDMVLSIEQPIGVS